MKKFFCVDNAGRCDVINAFNKMGALSRIEYPEYVRLILTETEAIRLAKEIWNEIPKLKRKLLEE